MTNDIDLDDDDSLVQVSHLVPASDRDAAQAASEYGELSDRVRTAYKVVAYGEAAGRESELKQELNNVRDRKDRIRSEVRELQTKLETLQTRETRLEERLEEVQTMGERYEGHLESIETQIRAGMNVFPDHGAIKRAAKQAETTPENVIEELRERNPELPDRAFQRASAAEHEWHGVEKDEELLSSAATDADGTPEDE